ncbi:MAG: hypothetical protein AAB963_02020 [Patescibacteria group bacterium]
MQLYPIKLYFKNWPIFITTVVALCLNIAAWIWLLIEIRPQTEPVFLHYNILFGVDYVGEWWQVLYLPISGLVIIIVNAVMGWLLFSRDKFLAQILNGISLFCQLFLFIAAALLVFLNV